jgi:hypothetical protein
MGNRDGIMMHSCFWKRAFKGVEKSSFSLFAQYFGDFLKEKLKEKDNLDSQQVSGCMRAPYNFF